MSQPATVPDSGQGYLHINPISLVAPDGTVAFTPETMIQYPEGSPEYAYILSLIGAWDNYASPIININAELVVEVTAADAAGMLTGNAVGAGGCSAYIYGWPSDSPNYMGSTAFIVFSSPPMTVPVSTALCSVHVNVTGEVNFDGENSVTVNIAHVPPTPQRSDVTIQVHGQGQTIPASGRYLDLFPQGDNLTITVIPDTGWDFDYMARNGRDITCNTINNLSAVETIDVYFAQTSTPSSYSDVTITVTGQGTTVPAAGNYPNTFLEGTDLSILPIPESGWHFAKFKRNGVELTNEISNLATTENIEVIFEIGEASLSATQDNAMLVAGVGVAAIVAGGLYYYQKRRNRVRAAKD
jgi:hypothetical protein